MRRYLSFAAVLVVAPAFADAPAAAPKTAVAAPPVYFAGNAWFSVASDRVAAANYVSGVADRVAGALARCGFDSGDLGAAKVVVYVNSGDGDPATEDDARRTLVHLPLREGPSGATAADFAKDRAVARALVSGALRRLARAAGRKAAPSDWIVEALAWEAQISAYPGLLEWLVRASDEQGPGTLAQLAAPNADGLGSHSRAAFLLFRAVKADTSGDLRAVVAKAAMGEPLRECVVAAVPRLASGRESPETWWPAVFYREIDRRSPAVASPAGSAKTFAGLVRFVVWETPPGETAARDIVLDSGGLIARRADRSVAAEVTRRIFEIKIALLTVNPVWFNALRDYGVFLEQLPTATPEELAKLAGDVESEVVIARNLTAEIERALRGGLDAR